MATPNTRSGAVYQKARPGAVFIEDVAAAQKVRLSDRGIIAPAGPLTDAEETPNDFGAGPIKKQLPLRSTGSNFWILAAAGVAAYFIINK